MTAAEPMSTPDSGRRLTPAGAHVRERMTTPNDQRHPDDPVRSTGYVPCAQEHEPGRICILPEGHADDDTVGEREAAETLWRDDQGRDHDLDHPSGWDCDGDALSGPHETCTCRPATPPADDANRSPVSGGLDEGVRSKWASAEQAVRKAEHHFPADCLAEAIEVASRLAERLAAVEAERDYAKASQAETWGYVCEIAQTLGIEPDDGHPMDVVDRMTARAEAAEAERDTARREVGERIAAALRDAADEWPWHDMGETWLRARADALTSDDGSGA